MTIVLAKRGMLAMLFLPLASCTSLLDSDAVPVQSYLLRAAPAKEAAPRPMNATLRVSKPLPSPGLESDRIMLVQSDRRLNYFTGSRWAATIPDVVESLTVETLRATNAWAVVQDSRSGFPADYFLQISVRRFEADYTDQASVDAGAPTVHVSLNCVVGRRADRELLVSFVAEAVEQSAENRLAAVVEAFERATDKALAVVAERTAEAVRTSKSPSPP